MMLSTHEIALVQSSFTKIALTADQVAKTFYHRLFEVQPSVRTLFHGDLDQQGMKLMQMIAVVVTGLDYLEEVVVPAVQDLGRRHVAYGVRREHYAIVGEVLLWTLEKVLADEFTSDVKLAWANVYDLLAQTAVAAAYQ
jgi:hemoglobin-like flavoprotein